MKYQAETKPRNVEGAEWSSIDSTFYSSMDAAAMSIARFKEVWADKRGFDGEYRFVAYFEEDE